MCDNVLMAFVGRVVTWDVNTVASVAWDDPVLPPTSLYVVRSAR